MTRATCRRRPMSATRWWDTSGVSSHLWGMVSELSAQGAIPASIVEAAAAGDTMAFARIVQAHHDDMARVCQVICGDPDLAQDAAQTAWPIVWQKLRIAPRPGQASAVARDRRGQRGPAAAPQAAPRPGRDALEVADVGSQPATTRLRGPATSTSLAAFRLLPADDRALLSLRYVAASTRPRSAPRSGCPLRASDPGCRACVDRLRTEIGDD